MGFYEKHRQTMVAGFVSMFDQDEAYCRYAVKTYIEKPNCPFPKIGHDVRQALDARAAN